MTEKLTKAGPTAQPFMGISEVADYCGFTRQAAFNRAVRGSLPKPVARLAMGPIWETETIVQYCEVHEITPAGRKALEPNPHD